MSPVLASVNATVAVLLIGIFVDRTVRGADYAVVPLIIAAALAAMTAFRIAQAQGDRDE